MLSNTIFVCVSDLLTKTCGYFMSVKYNILSSWITNVDFIVIHMMKVKSRGLRVLHGDLHLMKFVHY